MRTVIELDGGLRPESKVTIGGEIVGTIKGVSNNGSVMSVIVDDGVAVVAPIEDIPDAESTSTE